MQDYDTYKICPSASSLQDKNENNFICPVGECGKTMKNALSLRTHIAKSHVTNHVCPVLIFHCPVNNCLYNESSERYFKCLKYLKQHYRKVHAEKNLRCNQCNASFSQQGFLNSHIKQCGKTFKCSCGTEYTSREALLTHAKRKQHQIDDSLAPKIKPNKSSHGIENEEVKDDENNSTQSLLLILSETNEPGDKIIKPRLLLPKPAPLNSIPLPTLAALALSELSVFRESSVKVDMFTQTEPSLNYCCHRRSKLKRQLLTAKNHSNGIKRVSLSKITEHKRQRCSTETQTRSTLHSKRQKTSAETQTLDNHILEKAMAEANLLVTCHSSSAKENLDCFPRQSTYTQTMFDDEQSFWPDLGPLTALIRNTSSTQTNLNNRQCNSSQTERDVFLGHMELEYNISNFSSVESSSEDDSRSTVPYGVLNSDVNSRENLVTTCETQTELDLDSLLMCNENNILCSNIQTQTTDDNLESIPYDQLLMTHMHTQTNELLFPELSFSDIQTQTSWSDFIDENMLQSSSQTQTKSLQVEGIAEFTDSHTQTPFK